MTRGRIWATSEDGKIEYVSLTADKLNETLEVLRKSFFRYENVCRGVGLSNSPEAIAECDDLVLDTAKHGVSVIAVDKNRSKIVGVMLNKIQHKNTSSKEYYEAYMKKAKYSETKGIFTFLIEYEDAVDPFTLYDADCLLELLFLTVLPEYGGRGIGFKLCEASIELATHLYKGENVKTPLDGKQLALEPRPQIVTALFTTHLSQKIARKLNFNILKTVNWNDLFWNGRTYASALQDEKSSGITFECKRLE